MVFRCKLNFFNAIRFQHGCSIHFHRCCRHVVVDVLEDVMNVGQLVGHKHVQGSCRPTVEEGATVRDCDDDREVVAGDWQCSAYKQLPLGTFAGDAVDCWLLPRKRWL
jgi:hypothetical protein